MEKLNIRDLEYFTGTEDYHPHYFANRKLLLTDGCQHVAEYAEAYWLFTLILSYQGSRQLLAEDFQVWKLEKQPQGGWLVTCDDGNDKVLITQQVPYSDFPLDSIKFYVRDSICMLPSEY